MLSGARQGEGITVARRDEFYEGKRDANPYAPPACYDEIEMPRGSALGPLIGLAAVSCGFGLVWHMWWLAALGLVGVAAAIIARSFVRDAKRVLSPAEIEAIERGWLTGVHEHRPILREMETMSANRGLAEAVPA